MTATLEKQGYKYTEEFGYIPRDWNINSLDDLCSIITKQTGFDYSAYIKPSLIKENIGKVYPFIQNKDFNGKYINLNTDFFIPIDIANKFQKILIDQPSLLISISGKIGNVGYCNLRNKAFIGGAVGICKLNENINGLYIMYHLLSNLGQNSLIGSIKASSHMNITVEDIRKVTVLLPSNAEQKKITKVLSDIDELIESTQKLIDKKKDLKTATMQKLLTPKSNWERETLGNIANIQRGASPRPIDSPIWFDDNSDIGWTRISDIDGKYLDSTEQHLSTLGIKNSRFVKHDNLIMSICATLGKPTITKFDICIHDGFVCFYDLNQNLEYTYYLLESIENTWLYRGQIGSQSNLNTDLIKNTIIYLPKLEEQRQIAQVLSDMDSEIGALEKELNKYKDLKIGMMQDLLTGKIRLVASNKEESKVISITEAKPKTKANDEFKDAVLISMLAYKFGSNKYPLGAFRRQKLSYFFKRHCNIPIDEYEKKAMGPYNPKMKYQGGEGIALRNKYVSKIGSRGLIATKNIDKAKEYFDRYYSEDNLTWLEQKFKYTSNNELEVLATVDYTIGDLKSQNKDITLENIKSYISCDKEWKPKLDKDYFNDKAILKAMVTSKTLFSSY